MDPKIIKIDEHTWSIDEMGVRFFLLEGEKEALLIDCGMMTKNALDIASELTSLPIKLILTHTDPDHMGSIAQFQEFYMHPAEATNFYYTQKRQGNFLPVWDQDIIDLGNRPLKIIHTPGHTPGSIAIWDLNHKRIFTGDPIQDGNIFMFGPQREGHSYIHGLRRIYDLRNEIDQIYPSHGTCPISFDIIPALEEGMKKLLNGELTGQAVDFHGVPLWRYDVGVAGFLGHRE